MKIHVGQGEAIKPLVNFVKEVSQSLFQVHHQDSKVDRGVAGACLICSVSGTHVRAGA
jgi:hypothetical protein